MKKILAIILALCMLFSVNVVAFAEDATQTLVEFWFDEATIEVTVNDEIPTEKEQYYDVTIAPNTSLEGNGISVTEPESDDEENIFYGWKVRTFIENSWVELDGVPIMSTEEALEYKVSGEGIQFRAVWWDTMDDYYSTVVIDGYEGEFTYKDVFFDDDEPTTMWLGSVEKGMTLDKAPDSELVIKSDPVRDGYTFEGWLQYDDTNDGFRSYDVYTTEQIVNQMPVPEYDVWYIAKYAEISMDEYNEYVDEEEMESSTIVFDANGGTVEVSMTIEEYDYNDSYTTPAFAADVFEGASLQETFDEAENMLGFKFGLDFTNGSKVIEDWTVYTAQSITYEYTDHGETPDVQLADDEILILTEADEEFNMDTYVIIKGCEVYDKSMTTDEVMNLAIDQNYYAVANWADPVVDNLQTSTDEEPSPEKEPTTDTVKKSPATGGEFMFAPMLVVVIAMMGVVLTFKKSKKQTN